MSESKLIYPELSYKIVGILYDVYNELGYGYREKYYQRAVKELLKLNKINFQKELSCPLSIKQQKIGRLQMDFLIENKIVLELKVAEEIYPRHIKQVLGYLKIRKLKLGILAVFTKKELQFKRIINLYN